MTYDISIFHRDTQTREQAYIGEDFFDEEDHLIPFTREQEDVLTEELVSAGYVFESTIMDYSNFNHPDYGSALLTPSALYLTASFDGDAIFEVGMFASELVMDHPDFSKYDPQAGGWEEFDNEDEDGD